MQPDAVTRLVRACEPNESLNPSDPRYVNCDDVRGDSLVDGYVRGLRRADPLRPQVLLFAGHRGIGKTCELNRLKAILEQPQSESSPHFPFKVIYIDVTDRLDLNDLDLPDLLVLIAAEVQEQLRHAGIPGFSALNTYLKKVWDDLKTTLLADVQIKETEIGGEFGSLTLELKNRPNARAQLRAEIEKRSTTLLDGVNDLLVTASDKLREKGHEGVVLIIDGLERLVFRILDGGTTTHDRLFLDRSDQLASLKVHTIYTVPISLFYSPRCAQLEQTLGEHNVPLPLIRLHDFQERDVPSDSPGMKKLLEMIEARCRFADVSITEAFDDLETARYLCKMTGGHPRHLMMFLQSAMNAIDALPITREAAEKAIRNYANSLLREVPDSYWAHLRAFELPQTDIPKDEPHQQMLFLLHVFEYMNGRPWYEVNPVIRTLPRFKQG